VWATNDTPRRVPGSSLQNRSGHRHRAVEAASWSDRMFAVGAGSVWIGDNFSIIRIDAHTGRRQAKLPVGCARRRGGIARGDDVVSVVGSISSACRGSMPKPARSWIPVRSRMQPASPRARARLLPSSAASGAARPCCKPPHFTAIDNNGSIGCCTSAPIKTMALRVPTSAYARHREGAR
jgi:hypothetical protein